MRGLGRRRISGGSRGGGAVWIYWYLQICRYKLVVKRGAVDFRTRPKKNDTTRASLLLPAAPLLLAAPPAKTAHLLILVVVVVVLLLLLHHHPPCTSFEVPGRRRDARRAGDEI